MTHFPDIGRAIAKTFIAAGANAILTGTKVDEIEQLEVIERNTNVKWVMANFGMWFEKIQDQFFTGQVS